MMRVVEPLPMYRDVKHGVSSLKVDTFDRLGESSALSDMVPFI